MCVDLRTANLRAHRIANAWKMAECFLQRFYMCVRVCVMGLRVVYHKNKLMKFIQIYHPLYEDDYQN